MTAFTDSAARRPRGMVKVYSASNQQGEVIDAWLEFEVNNNNFYSADTFHCTFAASALPANRNAGWFSAQKDMFIELFINNDIGSAQNSGFVSWIYGQVDEIDWNINRSESVV